jgi:phosphohistidine phosphatase SixA
VSDQPAGSDERNATGRNRRDLYLLRHADAGDPARWSGDDALRPLSGKGRRQADRLGRWLRALDPGPLAVIASPKVRAAETAAIVAASLGLEVRLDPRLAEGLDTQTAQEILDEPRSAGGVVLVGHDPDLSDLLSSLVGAPLQMRKGAIARLEIGDRLESGALLRWLVPPDALPRS